MRKLYLSFFCFLLVTTFMIGYNVVNSKSVNLHAYSPELENTSEELIYEEDQGQNQNLENTDISDIQKIIVYGGGKISVTPDVAYVMVGVESLNSELQTAVKENDEIVSSLINYLKEQGINEKDIKTKYYSIYQKHDYTASQRFLGYQVSSTLEFKCKDIDNLESYISELTNLGANKLEGITFNCENISQYYQEALKLAIEDAKNKAECLTDKTLSIYKVTEESMYTCLPYRITNELLYSSPSILKGTMEVEAKIKVIFKS